jgi:hypothetical protein
VSLGDRQDCAVDAWLDVGWERIWLPKIYDIFPLEICEERASGDCCWGGHTGLCLGSLELAQLWMVSVGCKDTLTFSRAKL